MFLLYKYYYKRKEISTNDIIIYFGLLLTILYFSRTLFTLLTISDIYLYNILNNFKIIQSNNTKKTNVKMEIVAEGVSKKETDTLVNTLVEYSEKFNK